MPRSHYRHWKYSEMCKGGVQCKGEKQVQEGLKNGHYDTCMLNEDEEWSSNIAKTKGFGSAGRLVNSDLLLYWASTYGYRFYIKIYHVQNL